MSKKNTLILFLFAVFTFTNLVSQDKKSLSYKDYNNWKSLEKAKISKNGEWISYEINPQEGNGYLYLYNTVTQKTDSVKRGTNAIFSTSNNFLAFKIVPQYDTIRTLKLAKKKPDDFPKDSLGIWDLKTGSIKKFPCIKSFALPEKKGDWLIAQFDKSFHLNNEPDSIKNDSIKSKQKDQKGTCLAYLNPVTGDSILFKNITLYNIPKYGKSLFLVQSSGDSIEENQIKILNTNTLQIDSIFSKTGNINSIVADDQAEQLGISFSPDTVKQKVYRLYYWNKKQLTQVTDTITKDLPENWCLNNNAKLWFSEDGKKLFFETSLRPEKEVKDTLTEDEKVHVDVWNWKDRRLQPMQKLNLEKDKNKGYSAVYIPAKNKLTQLESENIENTKPLDKGNINFVIGFDNKAYQRSSSWNGLWPEDLYKIDIFTGEKELIQKGINNRYSISPDGKYLAWFNSNDSIWYLTNTNKLSTIPLTKNINVPFYDELNDVPNIPRAYSVAGWSEKSNDVYINDRYDIWKIGTNGNTKPVCITNHQGRKTNTTYRYIKLDKEEEFIPDDTDLTLSFFNHKTKNSGYSVLKGDECIECINEPAHIYGLRKAKDSNTLIWRKGDFKNYPELYYSKDLFNSQTVISNTNPQQNQYKWGNIQLVDFNSLTGEKLEGLLVTPENMQKDKKYPMLVYYYERSSDRLHSYYAPKPSRSVINWTMYASNDYVIFIPDITYQSGIPGKSAYDAIMGGVSSMIQQFSFIDKDNIGLQGQSWGGYQTAYMVTQTNYFKAAMAGAPVSNMTSAYGGIRWGSGMSRMFQYEHTQSRIGATLWDNLPKYIENSPLFYAPQVETPLLIMHNDNDGAVPWYQGIEFFVALRRLNKPVWMLTYNNEEHNLTRRANSIDLSIRMMQFFDHYLKNKPAPVWMEYGIKAVDKGKELGYDLVE